LNPPIQRLFDSLGRLTLEDLAEVLADHHHILVDIEVLVLSTTLRRFRTLIRSAERGYLHQNLMGAPLTCMCEFGLLMKLT
jgi:hypothetical protein